jgi:hypothetical protein
LSFQNFLADNIDVQGLEPQLQRTAHLGEYPLSLNQQEVWCQCQIDPESILHNIGARIAISGPLQLETFCQAIQKTIDRHEILRTVFTVSDDIPVQATSRVISRMSVQCPVRDLPMLSPGESEERAFSRMKTLTRQSFDLCAGPLFRGEILRYDETKFCFIFAFHYLILDAFYCGEFMREIAFTYDRLRRGEPLPAIPDLQYGDYSVWLQERWNRGCVAPKATFWQEQLREPLPESHLPTERSVPIPRRLGSQVTLKLESELVRRLEEIATRYETTVFRVIVATLALFFSRLTETKELMLDIDFSVRPKEMSHTLGSFTNSLSMRFEVPMIEGFNQLLRRVDSKLRLAAENRDFPARRLIGESRNAHDPLRPLSSVRISPLGSLDLPVGELHMNGSIYLTETVYDLWLGVMEREGTLEINFGYADELFAEAKIQVWATCFHELMGELTSRPETKISELTSRRM